MTGTPRVAVLGYASRDHAMTVGTFHGPSGTTLVHDRLSTPWPANGGITHVLRAAASPPPASPVTEDPAPTPDAAAGPPSPPSIAGHSAPTPDAAGRSAPAPGVAVGSASPLSAPQAAGCSAPAPGVAVGSASPLSAPQAAGCSAPAPRVAAVSWVGPDDGGLGWLRELEMLGVDISGVAVRGTRTPSAYLFYPDDGSTVCVYDPGDCHDGGLGDAQRAVLAAADWCVVTVAPAPAIAAALDALPERARLAWAVKNDPDAFPPVLARRLAERAALITYSAGERDFLTAALGHPPAATTGGLVVETRGPAGAAWWTGGTHGTTPGTPAAPGPAPARADTTGAGDTLIAATVVALAYGHAPGDAVAHGVAAAGRLIAARRTPAPDVPASAPPASTSPYGDDRQKGTT